MYIPFMYNTPARILSLPPTHMAGHRAISSFFFCLLTIRYRKEKPFGFHYLFIYARRNCDVAGKEVGAVSLSLPFLYIHRTYCIFLYLSGASRSIAMVTSNTKWIMQLIGYIILYSFICIADCWNGQHFTTCLCFHLTQRRETKEEKLNLVEIMLLGNGIKALIELPFGRSVFGQHLRLISIYIFRKSIPMGFEKYILV